jgi:hypothetical protein
MSFSGALLCAARDPGKADSKLTRGDGINERPTDGPANPDDADEFYLQEARTSLILPARQRPYHQFKWPHGLNSDKVALVLGDHTRANRASR